MEKHRVHFCVGPDPSEHELFQTRVAELERLKKLKADLRRDRDEKERRLTSRDDDDARSSQTEELWDVRSAGLLRLQKQEKHYKDLTILRPRDEPNSNRESVASSISIQLPPSPGLPTERGTPVVNASEQIFQMMEAQTQLYKERLRENKRRMEQLILQKQEIDDRLRSYEQGRQQPIGGSTDLLDQLKTKQEQNQVTLLRLQQQLQLDTENQSGLNAEQKRDFLLKELNAVRQRYLQNGGSNPEILMDIADIEKEALDLLERHSELDQEEQENQEKCQILSEELEAFESENCRLEEELIRLHESNTEKLEFQVHSYDEEMADELLTARREQQARETARLEHEIELANQEARLERIKRRLEKLGFNRSKKGAAALN